MSLTQTLQDFRNSILSINRLIATAHATDSLGNNLWATNETTFFTESAFLKMFIAWESFLEKSFVLYLTGNLSITGNAITRYATPINEEHAHKILIGVMEFVDWSRPDKVKILAEIYFDSGEPYKTAINSIHSDLQDLKIIRNASAHLSTTTQGKLENLALRKLGRPSIGISVSDLITAIDPNSPSKTILQSYQDLLDAAADIIAKN